MNLDEHFRTGIGKAENDTDLTFGEVVVSDQYMGDVLLCSEGDPRPRRRYLKGDCPHTVSVLPRIGEWLAVCPF